MNLLVKLLRLDKESPKKCSLTPLRAQQRESFEFIDCFLGQKIDVGEVTLLHPEGTPLSSVDCTRDLLLIDCSWRDLPRVIKGISGDLRLRSLPKDLQTAYPRKSSIFEDPETGLATIEALHAALCQLGHRDDSILDGYHWKEQWLELNSKLIESDS